MSTPELSTPDFSTLGLNTKILKSITTSGYTSPTAVQQAAIPKAVEGLDLLVSSKTGSGKTAAFILPIIHKITTSQPTKRCVRALVLTPTRELALQVLAAANVHGRALGVKATALVGGTAYSKQLQDLSRPLDLIVATPGRLIDHLRSRRTNLSKLEFLVLDEADRMLQMGFIADIEHVVSQTPIERQTLLFSATLDASIKEIASRMMKDPLHINITETSSNGIENIEQQMFYTDNHHHKTRILDSLLRDTEVKQSIVFASTKRGAEELCESLGMRGFSVATLHGDMKQSQRNRTLQGLRDGRTAILVATDVAARGIDVAGISHVINFDPPRAAEDYVHRIGRTGRAGRSGIAITLVTQKDGGIIRNIERYTGKQIAVKTVSGLEPTQRTESAGGYRSKPSYEKTNKSRHSHSQEWTNDRFNPKRTKPVTSTSHYGNDVGITSSREYTRDPRESSMRRDERKPFYGNKGSLSNFAEQPKQARSPHHHQPLTERPLRSASRAHSTGKFAGAPHSSVPVSTSKKRLDRNKATSHYR